MRKVCTPLLWAKYWVFLGPCSSKRRLQTLATVNHRRYLRRADERDIPNTLAVLEMLYGFERTATDVQTTTQHQLPYESRTESLAVEILIALQDAIKADKAMCPAVKATYEDAQQRVNDVP